MPQVLRIQEPSGSDDLSPSFSAFLELAFRPLYLLGAAWAAIAVLVWVFAPHWLSGQLQGVMWHGHEMLWGFIVTIAVGFLMTAGATWTGINPLSHKALLLICLFWLIARVAYLFGSPLAFLIGVGFETAFLLLPAVAMARAVILSKNQRNYGVPLVMLALSAANGAYLWAVWLGDYDLVLRYFHVGLMLMAMLVLLVGRRIIPFFSMRAVPGLQIPKHTRSGQLQLGLSLLAVLGMAFDQSVLTAAALVIVGLISVWQVLSWKPWAVRSRPILWVLYLGYFVTGVGLLGAAVKVLDPSLRAAWPIHTIAMGGFSVLIIGMITRTALGHLGRPLQLSRLMVLCYWLIVLATVLRLTALVPSVFSSLALGAAGTLWAAAFLFYVAEFLPRMIRPRPGPGAR